MGIGDNRKNPRPQGSTGSRQTTTITVNPSGVASVSPWAQPGNTDLIPEAKIPGVAGGADPDTINALIRAGVSPWAQPGNTDPVPGTKIPSRASGDASLIMASKEATFTLPSLAQITLTAPQANVEVQHKLAGFAGNGVPLYIVPSVVDGAGRITFPEEGLISGHLTASLDVASSTAGSSGSVAHLSFLVSLYNSDGTLKVQWRHTDIINDPVTRAYIDPVGISINATPIDANSYLTMKVTFDSATANTNVRVSIPDASTARREQIDVFYYTKKQVENWCVVNNTDKIPVDKLPTSATEGLNQQEVDARISPWARPNNTDVIPTNKLPPDIGTGSQAGTATWAQPGNTDSIPPNKLKDILDPTNNVNVLRDVSTAGTVSRLTLPSNYATAFRYLLVAGHANSEFGIIDTHYLAALATVRSETYNWTRATRLLEGVIKGAYLYGIDDKLSFSEDGWLRATETTIAPVQPTTSANDGIGSINVSQGNINKFPFFAFRVFEPGTIQFLPNQFYKDLGVDAERVFRVHNEALTKTLKIERTSSTEWEFSSYNEMTSRDINELRSLNFIGFHNIEDITPDTTVNTITLPRGFRDKDFLVAVTKNDSNDYWTVWTLKTKFPEFTPQLANGGAFTPGENILYASLITVHGELEIKAEDVSVDESNLTNIAGDTVQEALDSVDNVIQTQAKTKNYAKVGNAEKIPFTDYGTSGTVAEIQAIPSNQLIPNHLYVAFNS